MKTRMFFALMILFFINTLIFADDITITECMKLLGGTWVNNEYHDMGKWGKKVLNENGISDDYFEVSGSKPSMKAQIIINELWTNNEGNIWFKSNVYDGGYFEGAEANIFELNKISNSGTVWEFMFSYHDYPTKIDAETYFYRIYYRQE